MTRQSARCDKAPFRSYGKPLNPGFLWDRSRIAPVPLPNLLAMSAKYYTHFVTRPQDSQKQDALREFTGVVELMQVPHGADSGKKASAREIAAVLANTLQIDSEDIHIL